MPIPGQESADLAHAIERASGHRLGLKPEPVAAGGGGGRCLRWPAAPAPLFVKLVPEARAAMLVAEAAGLEELARVGVLRVPAVRGVGTTDGVAFLALEWIALRNGSARAEAALGTGLARLHRCTAARHGWQRDNTLGATSQPNAWHGDWAEFFATRRLGHQLGLLERAGGHAALVADGRRLCERVATLLEGHRPPPALLHGDLWGGNWAADAADAPVIFDPAVYYGDRETDLAMTRLFGGFGPEFYAAYEREWPLPPGAAGRAALYNLYHVLNHANLFGGGYAAQATSMIGRLLSELR